MTPKELLSRTPVKEDHDLHILMGCYYNHIPEVGDYCYEDIVWEHDKVTIKYYKDYWEDSRRCWILASVHFDYGPVMIIQNAGREGDDHRKRFVIDSLRYIKMIAYIRSVMIKYNVMKIWDPNKDIKGLDNFYGDKL